MGVSSEAWAVVGWKSADEAVQEGEGSVGNSAGLVGEGVEFVGEVTEGGTPGLVFGGDAGSVGGTGGGGAVGAIVGRGRHEDGAAGNDIGDDFGAIVGGVDNVGPFGVVGDHAGHFCAGAQADHAADGSVGVAEWIMPEGGTVGEAAATAEGVVTVGINDGVGCCRGWFGSEGGVAEAAMVGNGRGKW